MNKLNQINSHSQKFDSVLLTSFLLLLGTSIVMVTSASMPVTEKYRVNDFYFLIQHLIHMAISVICWIVITFIPIKYIKKITIHAAILGLMSLVLVFIPGLSKPINGAYRWIFIGPISVQPSEFCKLMLIIYISGYLVRRKQNVQNKFSGFIVPLIVLTMYDILLLLQPDFGVVFILSCVVIMLLFIAGVKFKYIFFLLLLSSLGSASLIVTSPYRMQRVIGFLDPWENQFNKGYQLVQSLIAFGRGGWFGLGLGNSIQKLMYLPEAYTDFIFAIIAEELGLFGGILILSLFSILAMRCFKIARAAMQSKKFFMAYLAYGLSCWISLQALVNIAVNLGLLPTKGLTLPFISYGGNSLFSCCVALGILFRIDFELKTSNS